MKKLKSLFLPAFILCTMLAVPTSVFALSGAGSEENPFVVTTEDELALLNAFPDCCFELGNDIEMTKNWVPVVERFTGSLDGKGLTLSNFKILTNNSAAFILYNYGTIKNLNIVMSESGVSASNSYAGGIVLNNYGLIEKCSVTGNVKGYYDAGGIACVNYKGGIISNCRVKGKVSSGTYAGGIAAKNTGTIEKCYFMGSVSAATDNYTSGITCGKIGSSGSEKSTVTDCYACCTFSSGNYSYGIAANGTITHCVYDKNVSGLSDTSYGTPKSTLAMKMKKTYTDMGWDFENVWGIDENYNDGYPYLLWEREPAEEPEEPSDEPTEEPEATKLSIVDVNCTDDSIKFISHVIINEEDTPSAFGTTFIPLWLLSSPDAKITKVEYDAGENPIVSGNTFGATLSGIPDGYKDVQFVGKSYIRLDDGSFIWSKAKKASIDASTLYMAEE